MRRCQCSIVRTKQNLTKFACPGCQRHYTGNVDCCIITLLNEHATRED